MKPDLATIEMDALMAEWREHVVAETGHFVGDGIVCKDGWSAAYPKVLFILKEPNGYEGQHGPLNELLRRAAAPNSTSAMWDRPTFHNLARWAYGLANYAGEVPAYEEAHRDYRSAVLGCAYINIKKSSGGARATKAVEAHAAMHAQFLRRQVDIIDPDIVVCGGTWRMLKDHVFPEMPRVSHRVHQLGGRIFINAFHPGCRTSRKDVYHQVLSSYHQYLTSVPPSPSQDAGDTPPRSEVVDEWSAKAIAITNRASTDEAYRKELAKSIR